MFWGKGGTELVGVTKQGLDQIGIHAMKVSLSLILPEEPGTTGWIVQRPRTKHNQKNVNEMISNTCRPEF